MNRIKASLLFVVIALLILLAVFFMVAIKARS